MVAFTPYLLYRPWLEGQSRDPFLPTPPIYPSQQLTGAGLARGWGWGIYSLAELGGVHKHPLPSGLGQCMYCMY